MREALVGTVLVTILVLAGCGGGGSSTKQSALDAINSVESQVQQICSKKPGACKQSKPKAKPAPSPTPKPVARCITTAGYGGLYSTVAAFNSHNNTTQGTQPQLGVAVWHVLATDHGCVSAYSVDEVTRPPQSASEIVFLTDGIGLPIDHTQPVQQGGCIVFSSRTLSQASGFRFARAEGAAQSGSTPAHAEIHLTNSGSC